MANPVTQDVQKRKPVNPKTLHAATASLNDDVQNCMAADGNYDAELFNFTNFLTHLTSVLEETAKMMPAFIPPEPEEEEAKVKKPETHKPEVHKEETKSHK